ncbi:MAG: hypothetical protein WC859_05270 [Elusimicrobiota bacterium]|jgi:hypothetical protein
MKAILLADPHALDFSKVAQALSKIRRIPLADAAQQARTQWGLIIEAVDEGVAVEWENQFTTLGVVVRMVNPSQVVSPPSAVSVSQLVLSKDHLTVTPAGGHALDIPMKDLWLLGACVFEEDSTTTVTRQEGPSIGQRVASAGVFLATGLPLSIGPKKQTVETKQHHSETHVYLDLITRLPDARYRLDGRQLDYSILGDRKQYHAMGNFRQLLQVISQSASDAWRNRGADILLANRSLAEMSYRSLSDLDHELRWLLTLRSLPT